MGRVENVTVFDLWLRDSRFNEAHRKPNYFLHEPLASPNHLSTFDGDLATSDSCHTFREEFAFGDLDTLVQRFGCVMVQNFHRLLRDDRSGIDPSIDEMDGASGELHAMLQ